MKFGALKMWLIVAALSLIGGAFSHAHNPEFDYRLPKNFKPINYTLDITTHLEPKFTFEGVVSIRVMCLEPTSTIVLHAINLEVDQEAVTLADEKGNPMNVSCVSSSPQLDTMYVSVLDEFDADEEYTVTIPFWGNITDDLVGYYKSSYLDQESLDTRWLAVTQFEPADARRAFPCFDEPAMKATFKIYLRHKQELNSFSNMPLVKRSPDPTHMNYVVQEFEETVPMSTYLVAYMVSDFVMVNSDVTKMGDVEFRILCRKDAAGQTKLARNTGPLALKYFEEYFDLKFPSSKMDMAAIPDFASGAMENWGLVTYRETALLVDPKVGTVDNSYRVAEVIAHELSHMWFGNMVTMKWWTDLWLNEGFATYVASRALDKLFPKWNTFQLETVSNFINVLELDALHSSHPVSVPVNHPDEIAQIFDTISYTKGSFLLHMMNNFLGESAFKQGIRNYIKKYKFNNAEQDELWTVMTKEAHRIGRLPDKMNLKEIMDTWTLQTGYPVVKVIRNYNHGIASITQERFFAIKPNGTKSKNCWWVPLTNTVYSKPNFNRTKPEAWLKCVKNIGELTMTVDKKEPWVIFNLQMAGLYRVMYDKDNWLAIIRTLNDPKEFKMIHTLNRAQLIEDSLSFAQIGQLDYETTFKLLSYLQHEDEYIPWSVAISGMAPINRLLKRTGHHGEYEVYMRRVLKPLYNKFHDMTVEMEGFEAIRFKNLVISQSCYYRLKACTEQAKKLFKKWMESPNPDTNNILPKELKTTIYCQGVKFGGQEAWDFLWKRYVRSNVAAEKSKILLSLGCTTDTYLLHRYLNWTIGENAVVRKQDAYLVFYAVSNNDLGFYLARDFLYNKVKEISKYYHPRGDRVGGYIESIGTEMKSKSELDEFQSFINKSKKYLTGTDMSVSQTIETIKINMEWTTNYYDKIIDYMGVGKAKDHKPESSKTRH